MGLTKQEFESLGDKILSLVEADSAQLWLQEAEALQLRSANNDITSNGVVNRFKIDLNVNYGQRSASIEINQSDESAIREAVKKVQEMAKLAPEDPEHLSPVEPGEYLTPTTHSEATANMRPEDLLAQMRPVIEQARKAGVDGAGYLERSVSSSCQLNTSGVSIFERSTGVNFSLTARAAEGRGSGWASTQVTDVEQLDLASAGDRAIQKALDSRHAKARDAGRTTIVLEAPGVRDLLSILSWNLGQRNYDEGRSFLKLLVGEDEEVIGNQLFGENATLYSDPLHADAPCSVHYFGVPRKKTMWIENGVMRNLMIPRYWAKKTGVDPLPWPGNLIMPGEGKTLEELIAGVEDGVLITRLWYLRQVQPQTLLYTGLTRDGTFAIEDGKIAGPVNNFRFNESPANVLKNIVASGIPERVVGSEGDSPAHVPPLVVKDFNLSSVSEAS
ncbi:MAG: TldD/PmbA family protein [Verrucomicrobiota bacterium]